MEDAKLKGYALGFVALWRRIPRTGPRSLGTDLYHCVDDEHEIYEFIKGPLRLLCFEADGALVLCSHVLRKKSQKTKGKDKAAAIALRARFLASSSADTLEIEEEGEP